MRAVTITKIIAFFISITIPIYLFSNIRDIIMIDEGQVSSEGLFFTEFQFGARITPHGDCIKVHGDYIFVTWYRGGMNDRMVMLSRKKIGGDTWQHIEFPHQHVMFRHNKNKGDSHNTIAIGISPIDDTIHLLYDMHAYTPSDFREKYFNYSYSKKGAAVVSDEQWNIGLFHPKQNYLNKKFVDSNPRYYWRVTYPGFSLMENGNLVVRWRIGGHVNATIYLTNYDGKEWSASHKWNDFATTSGVYASFGNYNGKMHATWHRRMLADHDKGYINNRGLYYGYSESESGLSDWFRSDGTNMGFPLREQEPFKLDDPSKPGQNLSQSPNFVITPSGAFHSIVQVGATVKHYYQALPESETMSSDGEYAGALYSFGDRIYNIGLRNGRPIISSTEEETSNWRVDFEVTTGNRYRHGNTIMVDDSIYYYLMEQGSGDKQPIRVLRFDLTGTR